MSFLRNTLTTYGTNHLRQNKIRLRTTYNEIVLLCVLNWLCATLVDVIQIYGNSNEWMGVGTNIFLSTDHLFTIYGPPTIYWTLTNHLPTPTEQLPTTYQPLFYCAACTLLPSVYCNTQTLHRVTSTVWDCQNIILMYSCDWL